MWTWGGQCRSGPEPTEDDSDPSHRPGRRTVGTGREYRSPPRPLRPPVLGTLVPELLALEVSVSPVKVAEASVRRAVVSFSHLTTKF